MRARIGMALRNARYGIGIIAAIYVVSVSAGMISVHSGSTFALTFRDSLVARAHGADPSARADDHGSHAAAAAIDFSRNLGLAAIPETIGGLIPVLPMASAGYRGWVGGVVSVDGAHRSRLRDPRSASYYVAVMLLQLAAFTLAGGAGVYLGWSFLKKRGPFVGPSWFRLPAPALRDVAWLYALIVPLFAAGSLWEFLMQVP